MALVLLIAYALTWPKWWNPSFAQNLLSEGAGIFFTTMILTPIVGYFLDRRREAQLKPIRRRFIQTVYIRFDGVLTIFDQIFPAIATLDMQLGALQATDKLSELSRALSVALRSTAIPSHPDINPKMQTTARALADVMNDISDLTRNIEDIERLIDINSPNQTREMIAQVSQLSESVRRDLAGFRSLARYFEGRASPKERTSAQSAKLDIMAIKYALEGLWRLVDGGDPPKSLDKPPVATLQQQERLMKAVYEKIGNLFYRDELDRDEVTLAYWEAAELARQEGKP